VRRALAKVERERRAARGVGALEEGAERVVVHGAATMRAGEGCVKRARRPRAAPRVARTRYAPRPMLPRLDVCVRLSPDEVALTVPRFGVTVSHPARIAVIRRPDGSLTVLAVGREARDLPDARTDEGLRWRRAPTESVLWRDTIAVACGSPEVAVSIDGRPWHGPSPHDLALPRTWGDRIGVALVLVLGAVVVWHPAARWLRELVAHERALHAAACVFLLQAAHAAWWHMRQQRRRASQRARLGRRGDA